MIHSEQTENITFPSVEFEWPIHTKLVAPNDNISELWCYHTQDMVKLDDISFEQEHVFKCDRNI